jgi:iron complex outermembrane receptor protein
LAALKRFSAADYTFRDIFDGNLVLSADYQYSSGFYLELDNVVRQPAYSLVNASLKWTSDSGDYTLTFWGDNLTNEAVLTSVVTQNFGTHDAYYSAPRTYGVKVGGARRASMAKASRCSRRT